MNDETETNVEGVVMYLHDFTEEFVRDNMGFRKTSPRHNIMALFFHADTGTLQLIDMKKVRAVHFEQLQCITPSVSTEPHQENTIPHSLEKSSIKSTIPAKSLEDMVYKGAAVTIGNQTIKCRHGLLEEFRKNYHQLEAEREINRSLTEQVSELKKQIDEQRQNPRQVHRSDDFGMEY